MTTDKENKFDPDELPAKDSFKEKQIYQYPQPAKPGKAIDPEEDKKHHELDHSKPQESSSKSEGLNEEKSKGNAGAFEGFEDQGEIKK